MIICRPWFANFSFWNHTKLVAEFSKCSACWYADPGPYTFILPATREVPRRLLHPKKRTVGVRIPDHPVVQALLAELGEPLLSSTLLLPDARSR